MVDLPLLGMGDVIASRVQLFCCICHRILVRKISKGVASSEGLRVTMR